MSGSFAPAADAAILMSAGDAGPAGTGAHALAVLWRSDPTLGINSGLASLYASSTQVRQLITDGGELFGTGDFSSGYPPNAIAANTWYVGVISKPAGSAHYRCHLWPYASDGSGVMDHGESGTAANHGDGSAITEIRVGRGDTRGNGLIAVVGVYNFEPTDGQLNTLKSGNLSAWAALGPSELISLENWNGTTGCTAVVGTSTQTGITGTVGVGANPPGFDFSVATPITASLNITLPAPAVALTGAAVASGRLAITLPPVGCGMGGRIVWSQGGWNQLLALGEEYRDSLAEQASRPLVACPDCGEPLETGPHGELHCRFSGWVSR